jgi:hypothetical protein
MRSLAARCVQFRSVSEGATSRADPTKGVVAIAEEDGVAAPCASAGILPASYYYLDVSSLSWDLFHRAIREKRDPASIGRPKRTCGPVSSGQRLGDDVIERPELEHRPASPDGGLKDQAAAVRR